MNLPGLLGASEMHAPSDSPLSSVSAIIFTPWLTHDARVQQEILSSSNSDTPVPLHLPTAINHGLTIYSYDSV